MPDYVASLVHGAFGSNVLNRGERSPCDFPHCTYQSPHIIPVGDTAASTPYRDSTHKDVLFGASVQCCEDGQGQVGFPHSFLSPPSQQ